jgi:hypothetical protein
MGRVFISSSSHDEELARDLARRLRNAGLEPVTFRDHSDRDNWRKKLREKIRTADAVLILVTPEALKSPWMMTELGMAEGMDRVVVPVSAGVKARDLPLPLADFAIVPFDKVDDAIEMLAGKLTPTV